MWRGLYRDSVKPEAFFDSSHLRALMDQVAGRRGSGTLEQTASRTAAWREEREKRFAALLERGERDGPDCFAQVVRALLVQSVPMASVLGAALQGLSAPGVFEDDVQVRALALLAEDVGVSRPRASRFDAYRLLLERERLTAYAVDAPELPSLTDVRDELFALPAVLLAMSRRSDTLLFELVGVDHALRSAGLLPGWAALRRHREPRADWARLDLGAASDRTGQTNPLEASARIAADCAALGADAERRVATGAAWFAGALELWDSRLLAVCGEVLDPDRAMAAMVRSRAREAAVYHHDFLLAGRDLATWLREAQQDPMPLVRALAGSKLVKPGDSARSPLVNGLIGPRGRMFRIFSPEDLAVLCRWIDRLPTSAPGGEATGVGADTAEAAGGGADAGREVAGGYPAPAVPDPALAQPGIAPESLREAYFVLQGRALAPRTRAYAVAYVRDWLDAARRTPEQPDHALPAAWPAEGLRGWLLDQHDRHDRAFTESDPGDLPSRQDVVDSTVQLAPLTLIDGSWLLGFTDIHLASSRIGFPLFETYWDELGNGQVPLNHPVIYRELLGEMGVELAPTSSRAFAHDERIREESLRLPVYWLSLGKLPETFLPEILGLNLAMELSGVGGSYRRARRFLRHYGFSTLFVDIHNTIDNVSTGHSAWAADAIDTHMRRFGPADPDRRAAEWERVRTGYTSLAPAPPRRGTLQTVRQSMRRRRPPSEQGARPESPGALMHHPSVKATGVKVTV